MRKPLQGIILAEPEGSQKNPPNATIFQAATQVAVFLCLGVLATRKRVYILFEAYLIAGYIFLQLIFHVLSYRFLISTDRIYIISSAPKMSVSVFVFQIRMSVEYHERTFSFQISHKVRYIYIRRDAHQHMYMIRTCFCFMYFYSFHFAQFPQYLSYICFYLPVYNLPSILRGKYYMVLAIPLRMC